HLVVAQDLEAGGVGADLEQRHERVATLVRKARDDPAHRQARGMRLDIEHRRLQARRLGEALAILDTVLSRRCNEYLDVADRGRAGADDAEVEADLIER